MGYHTNIASCGESNFIQLFVVREFMQIVTINSSKIKKIGTLKATTQRKQTVSEYVPYKF